jgi:tetratricopeptide (TPR) repeat protein
MKKPREHDAVSLNKRLKRDYDQLYEINFENEPTALYWQALVALVHSHHLTNDQLHLCKVWKNMKEKSIVLKDLSELSTRENIDTIVILLAQFGICRTKSPSEREMESLTECITKLDEMSSSFVQHNLLAVFLKARGNHFCSVNLYERAINDLTRAIKLHPNYAIAYSNRADVYGHLFNYDEALADYQRAIEIEPLYSSAHGCRANLLCELNRVEEALVEYDRAVELDPDNPTALYNRSITYADIGYFVCAMRDANLANESEGSELHQTNYDIYRDHILSCSNDSLTCFELW